MTSEPTMKLLLLLTWLRVPDRPYYWILDRLTDNNGWRPAAHALPRTLPGTHSPRRPMIA